MVEVKFVTVGAVVSVVVVSSVVEVVVVVFVVLLTASNTVSSTWSMASEIVSKEVVGISSSALRSMVEIPSITSSSINNSAVSRSWLY